MTRATQTLSVAFLATSLIPLPTIVQTEIVPVVRIHQIPTKIASSGSSSHSPTLLQLPFWFLVAFGAYILARLGWGILTFNDCPEAHKELVAEIELARADLRKLGVSID
ncbi:hypothetical protein SEPCBS119000_004051 [Sporothrix epigloea]|uniref:Dolichol-phosphate mannosyltransferase subunit 3 n=1 Tax=Sporothrix epigloea TaxID=1892477 RepID=A0ABP0DQ24_9PEZI